MEHHIIESADGSSSLMLNRFNESYHSSNGAFTEALHIYIREGVSYLFNKLICDSMNSATDNGQFHPITIIDIGLGTALNCITALLWQQRLRRRGLPYPHIHYIGIEKYPIDATEAKMLNFPEHIAGNQHLFHSESLSQKESGFTKESQEKGNLEIESMEEGNGVGICREETRVWYEMIHDAEWEKNIVLAPGFTITKHLADITTCKAEDFSSALYPDAPSAVFYDTFSPATQPDLWEKCIFEEIFKGIRRGSVLTTYCSKGIVKQALRETGFYLERLSGPPGKRHILRAIKNR